MIEYKIRRYLQRMRQPFGSRSVQSPGVYTFISEVISNRQPYYAYADLAAHLKSMSRHDRKVAKLLLRLSNYIRPAVALLPQDSRHFAPLVEHGCRQTAITLYAAHPDINPHTGAPLLIHIDATRAQPPCSPPPGQSAIVVHHIYHSRTALQTWRRLAATPWATITIDLGIAGVIYTNTKYSKQHYIINI